MTRTCVVQTCKSNYNKEDKIKIFSLPKTQTIRQQWLINLNVEETRFTKNVGLCIKHFKDNFINKVIKEDGSIHLSLSPDALPTENLYAPAPKRIAPAVLKEIQNKRLESIQSTNKIKDSQDLLNSSNLHKIVKTPWLITENETKILIYSVELSSLPPTITACILIYKNNLKCEVFYKQHKIKHQKLVEILGCKYFLDDWSKLKLLLHFVKDFHENDISYKDKIKYVISDLKHIESQVEEEDEEDESDLSLFEEDEEEDRTKVKTKRCLTFLIEQLENLLRISPRYSNQTILISISIMFISAAAYSNLRSFDALTLPSPKYLREMERHITSLTPGVQAESEFFLDEKGKMMTPRKRKVNLQFDEIYDKAMLTYAGGKLHGIALNSEDKIQLARTVQAFLISSLESPMKEIAALFPVRNQKYTHLLNYLSQVLNLLHRTSFEVVATSADNNAVNRRVYKELTKGSDSDIYIQNPNDLSKKMFLTYDTPHVGKKIWCNWEMASLEDKTLIIPNPRKLMFIIENKKVPEFNFISNTEDTKMASFSHLISLQNIEKNELLKYGVLNLQSVKPKNLQKQNVKLFLRIFDKRNCIGLRHFQQKILDKHKFSFMSVEGTCDFIMIISTWFAIVNVKSPSKGFRKRDIFSEPIRSLSDIQVIFLREFLKWLHKWEKSKVNYDQYDLYTADDEDDPDGDLDEFNLDGNEQDLQFLAEPRKIKLCKKKLQRLGKLTAETFQALEHTTRALLAYTEYCLVDQKMDYVLLGKIQSDNLERTFGYFRTYNGFSYNVNVEQILTCDRKLKIVRLLKFADEVENSELFKRFRSTKSKPVDSYSEDECIPFIEAVDQSADYNLSIEEQKISLAIGGYAVFKVASKLLCKDCIEFIVTQDKLDVLFSDDILEFVSEYDRGGLRLPTDDIFQFVLRAYSLFTVLISKNYLMKFATSSHQRKIFLSLCSDLIEDAAEASHTCTECALHRSVLYERVLKHLTNTLLNNFIKNVNQDYEEKNRLNAREQRFNRKLTTLQP